MDWKRYEKFPYSGGLMEQPYEWKQQVDCVLAAHNRAEEERRIAEERERAERE